MKDSIKFILLFVLAACSNEQTGRKFPIQGVYVTAYETEYHKGIDTIEVTAINKEAGTFYYVRRIGFRRISDGKLGPLEHKMESSTCLYDESTAQIQEQRYGRVYSFSSDGKQIISGKLTYKRIQ
jgi:hypothetical protein